MVNRAWSKHTSNVLDFGFNHVQSRPWASGVKTTLDTIWLNVSCDCYCEMKNVPQNWYNSRGLRWSLHQGHSINHIFLHLLLTITNIVVNRYRSAAKCRWKFHFRLIYGDIQVVNFNIHLEPGFYINPFLSLLSFLSLKSFSNSRRPSAGFQIIWILHQNEDLKINRFTQRRKTSMSSGKLSSKWKVMFFFLF